MRSIVYSLLLIVVLGTGVACSNPNRGPVVFHGESEIHHIVPSPNGLTVAIVDDGGISLVSGKTSHVQKIPGSIVSWVRPIWDPSGKYLIYRQSDNPVRSAILDVQSHSIATVLDGYPTGYLAALRPDDPLYVDTKQGLSILSPGTWEIESLHLPPCAVVYFSSTEDRLVCRTQKSYYVTGLRSKASAREMPEETTQESVSGDGRWALVNRRGVDQTELLNLDSGEHVTVTPGDFWRAAWNEASEVAFIRSATHELMLYSRSNGELKDTGIVGQPAEVNQPLHWSPDGKTLWALVLNVRVNAWYTTTKAYLIKYDMTTQKLTSVRLQDAPVVAEWNDPARTLYAVYRSAPDILQELQLK